MRNALCAVVLACVASYGCGDDGGSSVICGAGTIEQNGECVVTGDVCDNGTVFDQTTGTCVPGDLCDTGTHLDETTGTCVPDVTCAPGEVPHNGICLSPEEIDADQADVTEASPDDNDPVYGGTPESLTLPGIGDSTIFTGQIGTPTDLDGDNQADQDWDFYQFDASAGDVVHVLIKSLGAASMGFLVLGPNNYVRFSPLFFVAEPRRDLVLPYTGTYFIAIAPQLRVAEIDTAIGAAPEGGDEYGYVATLERKPALTASDLVQGTPASGNFSDLTDNLYLIKASAGELVRSSLADPISVDVDPIFIVLDSSGTPTGEATAPELLHLAAANDDLHVLVDYVIMLGPDDAYSFGSELVTLNDLGSVAADGSLTAVPDPAVSVAPGDAAYFSVTVAAEQVVEIAVDMGSTAVSAPDVRVISAGDVVVARALDTSSGIRWYAPSGGTFVIEVLNDDDTDTGAVTLDVTSTSVVDLGSFDATTNTTATSTAMGLATKTNAYFKVTASEDLLLSIDVAQSSSVDLDGYLYTTMFDELTRDATSGTDPSMPFAVVSSGDVSLVRVFNFSSTTAATDVEVTVTASTAPTPEVEPNDTAATAQTLPDLNSVLGATSASSDKDYFTFTPTTTGLYKITATDLDGGTGLVVTLFNSAGDVLESDDVGSAPFTGAVLQASTDYVVLVEDDFGATNYVLSFEEITVATPLEMEPNDSSTATPVTITSAPETLTGSFGADGDADWFKVTLASGMDVAIEFVSVDLGGTALDVNTNATIEVYGSDGTTPITPTGATYSLPTGDSFIKVSGYDSNGGNTYAVFVNDNPPLVLSSVVNQVVNETNSPLTDILSVADTCTVSDLEIRVDITHQWRGDLVVDIQAPDGTTVRLHNETGGSANDLIGTYPTTLTPAEPLTPLIGKQAMGDWTMTVVDVFDDSFAGVWNSWGLSITCQ